MATKPLPQVGSLRRCKRMIKLGKMRTSRSWLSTWLLIPLQQKQSSELIAQNSCVLQALLWATSRRGSEWSSVALSKTRSQHWRMPRPLWTLCNPSRSLSRMSPKAWERMSAKVQKPPMKPVPWKKHWRAKVPNLGRRSSCKLPESVGWRICSSNVGATCWLPACNGCRSIRHLLRISASTSSWGSRWMSFCKSCSGQFRQTRFLVRFCLFSFLLVSVLDCYI